MEGFLPDLTYHMGGIFYVVGLAVDTLRHTFGKWATCLLNNTSSEILKTFVSSIVLAYVVKLWE